MTRNTLRQQIADALRDEVLAGRLQPGQQFTVKEIAEQYGVSATPVREALVDLSAQGLLDSTSTAASGSTSSPSTTTGAWSRPGPWSWTASSAASSPDRGASRAQATTCREAARVSGAAPGEEAAAGRPRPATSTSSSATTCASGGSSAGSSATRTSPTSCTGCASSAGCSPCRTCAAAVPGCWDGHRAGRGHVASWRRPSPRARHRGRAGGGIVARTTSTAADRRRRRRRLDDAGLREPGRDGTAVRRRRRMLSRPSHAPASTRWRASSRGL